jgi:outer membrane protein assembly factor BamB
MSRTVTLVATIVLTVAAPAVAQLLSRDHPGEYASDLLFTGGREGYFYALDARTGTELWKASLGGQIVNGPISYAVDGKQYVAVISGHSLITFGLRE